MSAIISECEKYRYVLNRDIPQAVRWVKPMLFIMLNPSTADANIDDATIRRCIRFAKDRLHTKMTVVNLFALRATDPEKLAPRCPEEGFDPIGPDNNTHLKNEIAKHAVIGTIIAAWGAKEIAETRSQWIADNVDREMLGKIWCLGKTKSGAPKHLLFIKADTEFQEYKLV